MTGTHDTNVITRIPAGPHSRRNPRTVAKVRIAVAIWLLMLAGIVWSRGSDWGLALLAPAAMHLWLAGRLLARVQGQH